MRKTGFAIASATVAFSMNFAGAQAKSCSDVLNTCMKMYGGQVRGHSPINPEAQCRNDFNGCMQTGTWAGQTLTVKGLEKK